VTEQIGSEQQPRDDEPGGQSTPSDDAGDGPVGLEDRTGRGGDTKGSPGANQAKAEPMPSTPGHRDPSAPLTPPLLEDMNVGVGDPQAPSHPAAAGSASSVEVARAPSATAPAGGSAHRTPGLQGSTGADEAVETDVAASAAAMGATGAPEHDDDPGHASDVPVTSSDAAGGTSEQQDAVRGARTASTTD
jgi:hypothetical protein